MVISILLKIGTVKLLKILYYISIIRGFPKVDHLGRSARIVLEQNKFSKKKLSLTGFELQTLGLSLVLTFSPHALPLC